MQVLTRENVKQPKTWEELYALPGFARPVRKELMMKGKLLWDYEMDPKTGMRPCGIEQCHTDHRHGYVVALPGGLLSHIGKDCGRTKFGVEWARMRSTFTREKREYAKSAAVRELRDELARQLAAWPALDNEEMQWARATLSSFDELPSKLRIALESRAEQGDSSIPGWRDETEAEMRQRKFFAHDPRQKIVQRQIPIERGPLIGLAGIRPNWRVDRWLDIKVPALLAEAEALLAKPGATTEELDGLSRRLNAAPGDVQSSARQLGLFVSQRNLELLPLVRAVDELGIRRVTYDRGPPPKLAVLYR